MDLVEQLRGKAKGQCVPMGAHTFAAAADEIESLRAKLESAKKCLVAWRCWKCGHELLEVPEKPFGPCPACGMDGHGHHLFCDDREELIRILTTE